MPYCLSSSCHAQEYRSTQLGHSVPTGKPYEWASGYSSRIVRITVPPISASRGLSGRTAGPGATVSCQADSPSAPGDDGRNSLGKSVTDPDRRGLDPAAAGVGDQLVHVPLACRDELLATGAWASAGRGSRTRSRCRTACGRACPAVIG